MSPQMIDDGLNGAIDYLRSDPVRTALVEALTLAREYVREHIASQRIHFGGFEGLSGIQTSEADLSRIDAALKAAGVELP